jgi:hypothetical protein
MRCKIKVFATSRRIQFMAMFVNCRFKRNRGMEAVRCAIYRIRQLNKAAGTPVLICKKNVDPLSPRLAAPVKKFSGVTDHCWY